MFSKFLGRHFVFVPTENCYRCKLCPKLMKGVKKANFVESARDHLFRLHPQIRKNDKEYQLLQQQSLWTTGQAVSSHFEKRERLVKALAKTTLPLNLFRDAANKEVLNALINLQHIPDHRTLTVDLKKLAESKLQQLKTVDFFGLQLDHWLNGQRQQCLLIWVSSITEKWALILQIIKFTFVPSTNQMSL